MNYVHVIPIHQVDPKLKRNKTLSAWDRRECTLPGGKRGNKASVWSDCHWDGGGLKSCVTVASGTVTQPRYLSKSGHWPHTIPGQLSASSHTSQRKNVEHRVESASPPAVQQPKRREAGSRGSPRRKCKRSCGPPNTPNCGRRSPRAVCEIRAGLCQPSVQKELH